MTRKRYYLHMCAVALVMATVMVDGTMPEPVMGFLALLGAACALGAIE